MAEKNTIGGKVTAVRGSRNLSLAQLAERTGAGKGSCTPATLALSSPWTPIP